MIRHLRGAWRLGHVALLVAQGWCRVRWQFPRIAPAEQHLHVQRWSQQLLQALGVSWRVLDASPDTTAAGHAWPPCLLVANHVSWLDIPVIHATHYCRLVAKADVQHWPVVGTMATAAGTLYLERAVRRDARRMVHSLSAALAQGDVVAVFPEGTTGDAQTLLPFHGNLLEAAIATDQPVRPVGLRFVQRGTCVVHPAPLYLGDTTLLASLWSVVSSAQPVEAVVHLGALQYAAQRNRRQWAHALQHDVQQLIDRIDGCS